MAIETGVGRQIWSCRKCRYGYRRVSARTEGFGKPEWKGAERSEKGDSVNGGPIEERNDGRDGDGLADVIGEDETGYGEGSKIGGRRCGDHGYPLAFPKRAHPCNVIPVVIYHYYLVNIIALHTHVSHSRNLHDRSPPARGRLQNPNLVERVVRCAHARKLL